jgi:hypothetical protein
VQLIIVECERFVGLNVGPFFFLSLNCELLLFPLTIEELMVVHGGFGSGWLEVACLVREWLRFFMFRCLRKKMMNSEGKRMSFFFILFEYVCVIKSERMTESVFGLRSFVRML